MRAYLDHAAATPIISEIWDELEASLKNDFANSASAHKAGKSLHRKVEEARDYFLEIMNAEDSYEFIFTASATESNNSILKDWVGKSAENILASSADHPSLTKIFSSFSEIPLSNDGSINREGLLSLITPQTELLVLAHINNHTGNLHDLKALCREVKKINPSVHIHVDATQSFSKYPLTLGSSEIDSLSISGHKIGAMKGIAGLYFKQSYKFTPIFFGGGHEKNYRSSTLNVPGVISFQAATKFHLSFRDEHLKNLEDINNYCFEKLNSLDLNIKFPFKEKSSAYILSIILPGPSADIIMRNLERKEIYVSTSSACSSKIKEDNPVFDALHIPKDWQKNALRVSFSHTTAKNEIDYFCECLEEIMKELKAAGLY